MTIFLAIETSQRIGGVALRDESINRGEIQIEMLAATGRHDDDLLPAIDRLFKRCGLTPRDLTAGRGVVGVSIGPGGFTGLRIAISTAKMLGEALGAGLVGVPSALAATESVFPTAGAGGPDAIVVALASKAQSAWCTRMSRARTGAAAERVWSIRDAGLADAATLGVHGVEVVLADEFFPESMRMRCEASGISVLQPRFDPQACLIVADQLWRAGAVADPLTLSPLYPRQPEAVTIWERRLAK